MKGRWWELVMELLLLIVVVTALVLAVGAVQTLAAELTGSHVLTLEQSDDGEIYAALSIVVELAASPKWSTVLIHDQTATWRPGMPGTDRGAEWDASIVWRPAPEWSVSLGRRWRTAPAGSAGPWIYLQVWRGM